MAIESFADIVRTHAAGRPDAIAIVDGSRRLTWAGLYERARRVAAGLAELGVGAEDRVAILDKNGAEFFELLYGAALVGAVVVPVNWRLAPPEIAVVVDDSTAKVLVVGAEFLPALDAATFERDPFVLVVGEADRPGAVRWPDWVDTHDAADVAPRPANPADTALQLYSSGTTGRPKGVMLTNANFLGLLPSAIDLWDVPDSVVSLVAMPLFHIGGSGWALVAQYAGGRSVILRDMDPGALVELIGAERITHAFVVPAVLQFVLATPGSKEGDYSSLTAICYGASPISQDVLERSLALFGCDFWQVYGLTETTGAIAHLPPSDHDPNGPTRYRLRSCGLAGPGVGLRVVDPDSRADVPATPPGSEPAVGEILVRGVQVMKGYWNNGAATAEAIDADGWFRTGDVGYLDTDGYLYIHDRVKDMIVSGGENIYPAEVENALMAHPDIADVAVIGVPDDRWGETPKAIVVATPGAAPDPADIIAHARQRLAGFKCPTSVDFVDVLPRNPTGKILKKDLRAPFWEGRTRNVN